MCSMRSMSNRRSFLKLLALAAGTARPVSLGASRVSPGSALSGGAQTPAPPQAIRKSTLISMLPKEGSYAERFAIAREAGFEAIEMQTDRQR